MIERVVAVEERETITTECLPAEIMNFRQKEEMPFVLGPGFNLERHLDEISKKYIQKASQAAGGNMKKMADLLGLSYRSLRYLQAKYKTKSS